MIVKDTGPPDARIMLVGEAPGREESIQGKPFVGASGKLMRGMLLHCGIRAQDCYITNVVNEQPPGNKFEYFYERKGIPSKALEAFQENLRSKIERIKPQLVLLLGAEALRAVTNKAPISAWRGTFLSYKGTKVMPTYHPAAVLREYKLHPIFEMDVTKALSRKVKAWPRILIKPTLEEVIQFCEEAQKASLVSWDIETVDKEIRSLAFAFRDKNLQTKAISIPFIRFPSPGCIILSETKIKLPSEAYSSYWSPGAELLVLEAIARLMASSVPFIGQNSISFDAPLFQRSFHIQPTNHKYDLMHMWHLLYCEFPKSLSFICSVLTDYPNYWTEKDTLIDEEEWTYNAQDSIVTLEGGEKVLEELKETNQLTFYQEHIHPLAQAIVEMEANGVLIDDAKRKEHLEQQKVRSARALEELKEIVGHEVNPGSPKQVKTLLYEELKFPKVRNPNTRRVTTDEEALRKLSKSYPKEPVFQKIIDYRKAEKLIGTYLELKTSVDGRLRSSYNVSGTETGRLSSSKNLFGEGTNLQNIPAGKGLDIVNLRDMFVAPPGKLLLKGDLKQAETMVVGEILDRLGFPQMHNHYQEPSFDVHTWAAAKTFKKPESEVTKRERDVCKIRNHSGNYMAGPNVMVKTALKYGVDIDYQLAKRLVQAIREQVPGIVNWWGDVERRLKRTRQLTTCFGRRRLFFGRIESTTIREAVAWEPQSTVGDLNNRILMDLQSMLPEECFVILQVHDELVLEVREDRLEECVKAFRAAATVPLCVSPHQPLVIPLELSVGKNWKDMKEL